MGRNYSATAVDTTLAAAITSTATSITVMGTTGFPTPPFVAAIIDSPGAQEVVQVTAVAGTTLTVIRGFDGTTAAAHPSTAVFRHVASAIDFREAQQHIDATTGVHGVGAGAVVGTSTTQSLTNKNLTSGTNTFPTFITGYLVPTGASFEWPSTAPAPAGFLLEDGGEYPIATYTALYNLLTANGTIFPFGANTNGSGAAGSTHFRMRNRAGRVAVGYNAADSDFNAIGKTGGAKTHTLSASEMPVHSHGLNAAGEHSHGGSTLWAGNHDHSVASITITDYFFAGGGGTVVVKSANGVTTYTSANGDHIHGISPDGSHTHTVDNAGGGAAHNNLQPYTVTNYIIKT